MGRVKAWGYVYRLARFYIVKTYCKLIWAPLHKSRRLADSRNREYTRQIEALQVINRFLLHGYLVSHVPH